MTFLGFTIGQWIVAIAEILLLFWFILKSVSAMKQNQQILIDELEALRKELKERKD